jgi:Plasmid pRiA4b ORF-3-like protein
MTVAVARTWLSIKVELVSGAGRVLWPRPGRIFAAARTHTFQQLADAIDDGFARWDRAHLHEFELLDGRRLCRPDLDGSGPDDDAARVVDLRWRTLAGLEAGAQFVYVFDLGDYWAHLCTVAATGIDPVEELGTVPEGPLPFFGWGDIPDQYGRRFGGDIDDGDPVPPDPQMRDLPPLLPGWGR